MNQSDLWTSLAQAFWQNALGYKRSALFFTKIANLFLATNSFFEHFFGPPAGLDTHRETDLNVVRSLNERLLIFESSQVHIWSQSVQDTLIGHFDAEKNNLLSTLLIKSLATEPLRTVTSPSYQLFWAHR